MKKRFILLCCVVLPVFVFAQPTTFDISSFTPPKGWKKSSSENAIQYTQTDEAKGIFCMITLYKSIPGKPDSKENFDMAWQTLVKEMVTVSTAPDMQPVVSDNGWEVQSGYAPFESDGSKGIVLLVSSSSGEKMVNITMLTNTDQYQQSVTDFLESINFKKQIATEPAKKNCQ
jgi:hypothetical protein